MNVELKDRFIGKITAMVKAEYDKGIEVGVLISSLFDLMLENFDISEEDAYDFSIGVVSDVISN